MNVKWTLALPWLLVAAIPLFTAAQSQTSSAAQPEKVQLPKGQMPVLGRPTKPDDTMPLFDFDNYFIGKWTFEWEVPETVFGPAGTITGTTVYKGLGGDSGFYEADTKANGPGGPFTVHETIAYQKENKTASRYVTDSRGFSYLQSGRVGGDLGGYFNIYFESAPFVYKGKSLRIKNGMRLLSPAQYKNVVTLSIDGGPFTNMSDPWWKKDLTAGSVGNR